MLGDGGTGARYLGSGEGDGLARIDLGTVTEGTGGLGISCRGSVGRAVAKAETVDDPLGAVLGSRPERVTVVSTPPTPGAGQAGVSGTLGSGGPSSADVEKHLLSGGSRTPDPRSGSSVSVGSSSAAELRAGSGDSPSHLGGLNSSRLVAADTFCFFGAGSSSAERA